MAEGTNATAILAEHKSALGDICRQVNSVLQASGDTGLAASMWRALVALLTHFATRTEPLLGRLRQHELDAAAHHTLTARMEIDIAALEKQLAEVRHLGPRGRYAARRASTVGRRASIAAPNGSPMRRRSTTAPTGFNVRQSSVKLPVDTAMLHADADYEEEGDDDDEEEEGEGEEKVVDEEDGELEVLHERLVSVTSDLVSERHRTQSLEREVATLRERLHTGGAIKVSHVNSAASRFLSTTNDHDDDDDHDGDEDNDDEARSRSSDLPDAPSAEAGAFAKAARERERALQVDGLQAKVRALNATVDEEAQRARRLELLRAEFVRRFSLAFVRQIERTIPVDDATSSAAATAISAGLYRRQSSSVGIALQGSGAGSFSRRQSSQVLSRRQSSQLGSPDSGGGSFADFRTRLGDSSTERSPKRRESHDSWDPTANSACA